MLDRDRIGAVGHSAGAIAVSAVQGLDPWPGVSGSQNPIDAIVALDNLALQLDQGDSSGIEGPDPLGIEGLTEAEDIAPRVPAMGIAGDYFLTPVPFTVPPNPELKAFGFNLWQDADVPTYQVQIRGGTHSSSPNSRPSPPGGGRSATPWPNISPSPGSTAG